MTIGDVEVLPFRVPHDAAEPVAFSITCNGIKITQLTDVGYMPEFVAEQLRGSHVLILESNHDMEMLRVGPYPWILKQRLMGRYGHLSNTAVAKFHPRTVRRNGGSFAARTSQLEKQSSGACTAGSLAGST